MKQFTDRKRQNTLLENRRQIFEASRSQTNKRITAEIRADNRYGNYRYRNFAQNKLGMSVPFGGFYDVKMKYSVYEVLGNGLVVLGTIGLIIGCICVGVTHTTGMTITHLKQLEAHHQITQYTHNCALAIICMILAMVVLWIVKFIFYRFRVRRYNFAEIISAFKGEYDEVMKAVKRHQETL